MATFARSFKPPAAYLSPCRRPGMPGRSLSNSSELSLASAASAAPPDDAADVPVSSAPATPLAVDEGRHPANKTSPGAAPAASVSPRASSSSSSRPIAIELPKMKKLNAASVYTPPEPISARGDLPGGYFPMHEDPKTRVHRPHPFHHYLHPDPVAMQPDRKTTAPVAAPMAQPSLAVSSYFAPGFHDSPLPVGKYYPSNYEQHQPSQAHSHGHTRTRPSFSDSLSSSVKSDSQLATHAQEPLRGDAAQAETRRKMQQYQRDMIAQASMALGRSAKMVSKSSLSAMPLRDAWLTGVSHKPASPRLDPLGSPGPVTPMDLETGSCSGYLERCPRLQDRLSKEAAPPGPGAAYTAHSL